MLFIEIEKQLLFFFVDIEIIVKEQFFYCWGFWGIIGDDVNDFNYLVNVQESEYEVGMCNIV